MPKRLGGLGFRNLHAFYLAMLGKQAWKFIENKNALVTKIFKAKYFPHVGFFEASIEHNPSYCWCSLWPTRALLKDGSQWKIGPGSSILVWNQPWVGSPHFASCIAYLDLGEIAINVRDLWILNQKTWNEPLLSIIFPIDQVQAILDTPISLAVTEDRLIWK